MRSVILGWFRCTCGGTVPVPHQLLDPPSKTIQAICSDVCGRVWEFTYDEAGAFTGFPPELVPQVLL